ncbi:glycosyltransferase family 2 protein [Cypionkella sp.]|uniref:glycosyltransferase family 2 protein n=1 Tax=Cypionkella sp. TaxID=2811411 RepID=UPI002ABB47BC|nr:glycosyltransferase family 2 protein [Cypionkella sp.]MDZ4393649.1 glycosyltransferase family 2 protein [Cypionkella sp.]
MRWSVVATVSEPAPLVAAFVAACVVRGATEVHLYLDTPQPALEAALAGVPGCVLIRCDAAYWRALPEGRPWAPSDRQRYNLQGAYDNSRVDWLLHIDADEFLSRGGDVAAALAALPASCLVAQVPVVERVYLTAPDPDDIFDGVFRRPNPLPLQAQVDAIDGAVAPFLRQGMTGYPSSKAFFRTGRGLQTDIHSARNVTLADISPLQGWQLHHFDGLTLQSWIGKRQRVIAQQPGWRSFAPARCAQLQAIAAEGATQDEHAALYLAIKQLSPARAAALAALDLITPGDLDLRGDLARVFPGLGFDLSVAGFDGCEIRYLARRPQGWVARIAAGLRRRVRRMRRAG